MFVQRLTQHPASPAACSPDFSSGPPFEQQENTKPGADIQAGEAPPARLTLTLTLAPTMTPAPHLTPQLTSTCRSTLLLPASLVTPRASPPADRRRGWRRRNQMLSPSLPSALGEPGKGVAFPFGTHPPPPPLRSGARNSALAEPRAPGYLRARRTRAERGSGGRGGALPGTPAQ